MNLPVDPEQRKRVEDFQLRHRVGFLTLLAVEIEDLTKLAKPLEKLEDKSLNGSGRAVMHGLLKDFKDFEEIGMAGNSFLHAFAKPADAVKFSLLLQGHLRAPGALSPNEVRSRVGIHLREMFANGIRGNAESGDLCNRQIETCIRVMLLGEPGQILMTRVAFDYCRQVVRASDRQLSAHTTELQWFNHGFYLVEGLNEPLEICEVRFGSDEPILPPSHSTKAAKYLTAESEPMPGWRPALEQRVPGTAWILEAKLDEDPFGEVWLARDDTFSENRVFQFCFRADFVRSVKNKEPLFGWLKAHAGKHPHMAEIQEVSFDEPPFYIMLNYVESVDLPAWSQKRGGAKDIPLETRIEIVSQIADALQFAHEAGIVHGDVRPGYILVGASATELRSASEPNHQTSLTEPASESIDVRLTGFGVGQILVNEYRTAATSFPTSTAKLTLYMAPECLAGQPASARSDVYSLGAVLYQLLIGDFSRGVTIDWALRIADRLLRDDLEKCFAGDPAERFGSAAELAWNLRNLPERRAELDRSQAQLAQHERATYRKELFRTAGFVTLGVALIASLAVFAFYRHPSSKAERGSVSPVVRAENPEPLPVETERVTTQRQLYDANLNLAQQAWEQNDIGRLRQLLEETQGFSERGFEWFYWQRQAHLALKTLRGHQGPVEAVAASPDGRRIVTGSSDKTARIWDAASGRNLLTLAGHTALISAIAFSPDGQRIVTGSYDRTAKVWEVQSGRELLTLSGHSNQITSVAFSPNGLKIATGSKDRTAKVWEAEAGKELLTLTGHVLQVTSVAFLPDGKRIVTGSGDQTARIWDVNRGSELFKLKGHSNAIHSVAVSPDGQRIVTGSEDQTARIWRLAGGRELLTLKGQGAPIYSVAFSRDGRRIVTGGFDQAAIVWDAGTGRQLLRLKGHSGPVRSANFSHDGRRIVTASDDRTAKVWETAPVPPALTLKGHTNWITLVALSVDQQRALTASVDQTVRMWDTESGRELLTLTNKGAPMSSAIFSPDGKWIAAGTGDGVTKVWETATGTEMQTFRGHFGRIFAMAYSPDGQRLVTGNLIGSAKVWETATGKDLLTFKAHNGPINALAFSLDGQWIITGSDDQTAGLWDAAGKEVHRLKGHSGAIRAVTFSPDGRRVATGSADWTVKVWDAASGKEILTLRGHTNGIFSVAFSPDGRRIVTGSEDQSAKIWDVASGRMLLTLSGQAAPIKAAAFSPDGHQITTWSGGLLSQELTLNVSKAARMEQVVAWQNEEKPAAQTLSPPSQGMPADPGTPPVRVQP